ncbi:hypothetical protein [Pseudodesulfovibrio methanolicus]|jgi:hypothetical protein|uniref:Uncharacterized protein n=1 Tax=Pseudodesulfovibrio methanolicus TaxID=3126690 RepID=A0ABZ2J0A7_9BACT
MNDLLKSDAFTRTRVDRFTGEPRRQWLEYADGVMEPVRKEGSLAKKFHGNKRSLDWWTVEKPLDWDPAEEGRKVSLNHDYGRPEGAASKQANAPTDRPAFAGPQPTALPRTLLAMGGQAVKEDGAALAEQRPTGSNADRNQETEQDAGTVQRSSAQDAAKLKAEEKFREPASPTIRMLRGVTKWLHEHGLEERDDRPRGGTSGLRG